MHYECIHRSCEPLFYFLWCIGSGRNCLEPECLELHMNSTCSLSQELASRTDSLNIASCWTLYASHWRHIHLRFVSPRSRCIKPFGRSESVGFATYDVSRSSLLHNFESVVELSNANTYRIVWIVHPWSFCVVTTIFEALLCATKEARLQDCFRSAILTSNVIGTRS